MSNQELRFSIKRLIEKTEDQDILTSVLILLTKSVGEEDDGAIGYELDGTPISEDELIISILEGKKEISKGIKIHLDQLKKDLGIDGRRTL